MTASTIGCRTNKRCHRLSHHVIAIDVVKGDRARAVRTEIKSTGTQKAERGQKVRSVRFVVIHGQLFTNQCGPVFVGVERSNEIVAIRPSVIATNIMFITVRLSKMNRVHPMPSPAFAVSFGGQ